MRRSVHLVAKDIHIVSWVAHVRLLPPSIPVRQPFETKTSTRQRASCFYNITRPLLCYEKGMLGSSVEKLYASIIVIRMLGLDYITCMSSKVQVGK
jgi:hypothetical protein